jgi:hypothetical protein
VRLAAGDIYRRNPMAFAGSPDRLKVGVYLSVAGQTGASQAAPLPGG